MKIAEAEIISSSKVDASYLGEFHQSFSLNNFEYSEKSYIGVEEEFKGEETDPRRKKHSKLVENVRISHETTSFDQNGNYLEQMVGAKATEYAR